MTEADPFASQLNTNSNNAFDDEERETLRRAEIDQQERFRSLSNKQSEEMKLKRERREVGKRSLDDWYAK
jgi:hypothetical protein